MSIAIRAVFLDAGGTLIHLDAPYILSALAEQGLARDADAFERADRAARASVISWLRAGNFGDDHTRWRLYAHTLLGELGCDDVVAAAIRQAVGSHHAAGLLWTRTLDGTADTLQRLRHDGYILGVVSNADGRVDRFLDHAGLLQYVDFVVDSGIVGIEKPDPGIFRIACERAGVAPHEAVHVGDVYEVDVRGARAAGVTPLLIDPDDFMADADCDRIHTIAELPRWLGARRNAA